MNPPFTQMALSIVQLNVNGLRSADKRGGLFCWLRSLPVSVDVVCLQETHSTSADECVSWFSTSGWSSLVSPGSRHSCGCVILYRPHLTLVRSWPDDGGRFLLCEFLLRGKVFRVACVYAPNRNPARDDFLDEVGDWIDPSVPTVVCGDFNTVFDRGLDRSGSDPLDTSRDSSEALARLFDDCCVVDAWRSLHPGVRAFTWLRPNGAFSSRIDLVGLPVAWSSSLVSCEIVPCPFSDHCAVLLTTDVPDLLGRGPGIWKLNVSVLSDAEFVSRVSSFWTHWRTRRDSFHSLADWWERGKSRLKGLAVSFCKERAERKRAQRDVLVRLVDHLKRQVDSGVASCLGPYRSALRDLERLDCADAEGARVRARVRWIEEGESSTAYFLRRERKQSADRWIPALRDANDVICSDLDGMSTVLSGFYSSLFSASQCDRNARETLLSFVSSSLPPDRAQSCEGLLSVEECFVALKGMARGKAPGVDGLPMEFYLKFWDVLGADLVEVLNSCFGRGLLAKSQRRGLISLTFKKGDRLDPRNWRPITLLTVDYKLASRVIAGRLLKVIGLVVDECQTCGVPGRFIGDNVAFLRDVVSYATSTGAPVAILSLDQEKAFDRVDWSFLRATLSKMGFGPSFIGWVDLFYAGPQSAVKFNGYTTPFFDLARGVRQGCPLSPLLYVLYAEVLACTIRGNPAIAGLAIPGLHSPLPVISQYADDTSLVVTSDRAIEGVFNSYALFEKGSGSKLNLSKSRGLLLGSWAGRLDPPGGLQWSSVKLKVLGAFVGPDDLEEDNWRPRITAIENSLGAWRARQLTCRGRALIINALGLSRVWYLASVISVPDWVKRTLTSLVFKFFWKGKVDLVTRNVVVQPLCSGGFGVVSIQLKVWALLVQWVRRFLGGCSAWRSFFWVYCLSCFRQSPWHVLSSPVPFDPGGLPPFYRDLLVAWKAVDGGFAVAKATLVTGLSSGLVTAEVSSVTTKSTYTYLLSEHRVDPHCMAKFAPQFGPLYWPLTWDQLHWFDIDRPVIDLSWKVAHGVLYTAKRLSAYGYAVAVDCFCGPAVESLEHLFFACPLAQSVLAWVSSLLFRCSPLAPALLCRHVLFGFNRDELRCVPRVFVYLLNVCKYFLWLARNDFRFRDIPPSALVVLENVKVRVRFNLPLFFKRFRSSRRRRYFVRQWGARGLVASVVDGALVVHL